MNGPKNLQWSWTPPVFQARRWGLLTPNLGFFVQFTPVSRPSVTDITEGGLSHGLSLTCLSPTPFFLVLFSPPCPGSAAQGSGRPDTSALPKVGWAEGPGAPRHPLPPATGDQSVRDEENHYRDRADTWHGHPVASAQGFHVAHRLFHLCVWSNWKLLKNSLLITLIDSQKKPPGDKSCKMRITASEQG